jgi:O-antigen/teichoic acid export membrane protein
MGRRGGLGALAASRLVFAASGLFVNLAMARWLPVEAFGVYRWIMSLCALGTFGTTLGLGPWLTRQLVEDPTRARPWVRVVVGVVGVLSAATGLAIVAWVGLADGRPDVVAAAAAAVVGLGLGAVASILEAGLHGLHRTRAEVMPTLWGRGALVVVNVGLLLAGFGVAAVMGGRVLTGALTAGLLGLAFVREAPATETSAPAWRDVLWEGRALGATVLFGAVYAQVDVVLLEALSGAEAVARYAAPSTVLLQLALLATVVTRASFPAVAAAGTADEASAEVRRASETLWALGVAIAAGGVAVSDALVPWLFGPAYAASAPVFAVLACAMPLRFLHGHFGLSLTARDRSAERARIDGLAAAFNIGINLLALRTGGAMAAACTTVATDLLLVLGTGRALGALLGAVVDVGRFARWGAAALAMAAVVTAVPGWPVGVRVGVGALSYGVFAVLFGAVSVVTLAGRWPIRGQSPHNRA